MLASRIFGRWPGRVSVALLSLFLPAGIGAGESGPCPMSRFENPPVAFPLDVLVFRGEVKEIALPSQGQQATPERDGFVLVVDVVDAIHVPTRRSRFELSLLPVTSTCEELLTLPLEQLTETYQAGDLLHVAAFPLPGGNERRLVALESWVRLAPDVRYRTVEDQYDYFAALLRVETAALEEEKLKVLRSVAEFVEDSDQFEALLAEQLSKRRFRRQLLAVHAALHAPDKNNERR